MNNTEKIPEKWCIRNTNQEIRDWFQINRQCPNIDDYKNEKVYVNEYFHYPGLTHNNLFHAFSTKQYGYEEITYNQFKQYILKQPLMKKYKFNDVIAKDSNIWVRCYNKKQAAKMRNLNLDCYNSWPIVVEGRTKEFNYDDHTYGNPIINFDEIDFGEIIGYKCPTDLYGSKVAKDTLYKPCFNPNYYEPERTKMGGKMDSVIMPKEIVETWQPVYKEEEKIMVGKWEAKADDNGVKFGQCQTFNRRDIEAYQKLTTSEVRAQINIQGTEITKELLQKLWNLAEN